ncbi:SDR family oxidoreductase [Sphingomonas paeninsulae]|uniref:SDR family oxidoreductase n=1 Tax=Sphingomonas paeninsulae TaxID=2319844 RepID=A0A494TFB7_SPHPE|nr:SDR family oxidoreductase [Sphingomonas paeninsulae]AYJ86044.1 SDR family oxidoreductase [Sphingomonas paeninsulae]
MKLALVTGGKRRVGAAIAKRLAADGWTLALHSHHEIADEAVYPGAHGFVADLADPDAADLLIDAVSSHFGTPPTLLVNNASRFEWDDVASMTPASLAGHHAVNAAAPVLLALALSRTHATGSVINILDQRIQNPNGDQLAYTLSKTALAGATRTLAAALAPRWRINAVAPGLTLPTADYDDAKMARLTDAMPLKRLSQPDEIAAAVAYLSGALSVTGQTIFVDGGASLKSFDRDFVFL